jgi:hypothetical protein
MPVSVPNQLERNKKNFKDVRKNMSKMRCLALLLGLVSCCFAARAQDVLVVANKGALISAISDASLHATFTG